MGILTHLDLFKNMKSLKKTKKKLKERFWTEIYQGAKLFYLSGLIHGILLLKNIFLTEFYKYRKISETRNT